MSQGLMAYLTWNVEAFTESVREVASSLNEATGELDALERDLESPVSWRDAAKHLTFRTDLHADAGEMYWALAERTIGSFKSRVLPNAPFMPCSIDRLVELDDELERQAIPIKVTDLVLGVSRYPWIPRPRSGSPLVSWWNPYDIDDAQAAMIAAKSPIDPWLAEAISTLQDWFARVRSSKPFPGWADSKPCIVGFYY
jgi:hypothetical protein